MLSSLSDINCESCKISHYTEESINWPNIIMESYSLIHHNLNTYYINSMESVCTILEHAKQKFKTREINVS